MLACTSGANAAGTTADPGTAPLTAAGGQLRAFWVDAFGDGMYTQAQIDQLVADVKAANMNAIVAQVVRRGDCLCNRSSLPRTAVAGVSPAPFDPLQSLIDAAHAQGIQVHAWIITTGVWQGPSVPTDPMHAFNQHGPSTTGAANWIDYRSDGASNLTDEYFIDPGNPDADRKGYVTMSNVNPVTEMVDLITATRGYEADTTAIKAVEGMAQHAMDVIR